MKILFIDQNFDATNIGGAFKSNYAIINELIKNPDSDISVLASKSDHIKRNNFIAKQITPILKTPVKKLNTLIKYLKINQYFSIISILKEIKRFKPEFIIVQRDLTFSAILAGFLKKVPVINIIRDGMGFCPKSIDTKGFKNCTSLLTKKECWECIDRWRTVRILLRDKPKGSNKTLLSAFYTIYYKIQFFITKLYLLILKHAYINIVASPLMKELVNKRLKNNRTLIRKITPVDNSKIKKSTNKIDKEILKKIESSDKIILFVIPRNEGGSKGYPFVEKLLNTSLNDYIFVVVGTLIDELKKYKNVVNIGKIPANNLYYLYERAKITIAPSIYTEAFGRIVLESVINKTPVLVSPQTGANYFFRDKQYVKILPLKTNVWISEIKNILANPITISDDEVKIIENTFSSEECANEIKNLIKRIKIQINS